MKKMNNLKKLRESKKKTLTQMSQEIGIGRGTINNYEVGRTEPSIANLEKLSNYFGVSIDKLLGIKDEETEIQPIDSWKNIPIIGNIACGSPILANENIDGFQAIPSNLVSQDNVFGLKCKGDSMEPTIKNGALVIIHQQPTIEDNEIAAVLINDSATLKRVKHVDNTILLLPDNQKYSPIVLNENDDNRILGKMILQINQY